MADQCEICGSGYPLRIIHDAIKIKGERLAATLYFGHTFCEVHERASFLLSPDGLKQIGYMDKFGVDHIFPWFGDYIDTWDKII